jgi:hypothetical protein
MAFRDIRKSRRLLSAADVGFLSLGLLLLAVLLAGNIYLARMLPGGEWFFLRWSAARDFLVTQITASDGTTAARIMPEGLLVLPAGGTGPYSTAIAQRTQEIVYGRQAFASEYNYVLNDPFFIVLLYLPFAFLQDFTLARGLWMLLSEAALIGIVWLSLVLAEWQPRVWLFIILLGFGLFQYFSLNALVTASPAILLTFLYLCILAALRSDSDELAGALLALVAYQWEVGGLFFLFVLFFAFANRRWGVLAGFGMALFVLLAVSFLTYSGWGLPYIRAVLSTWYRSESLNLGYIAATWLSNLRFPLGQAVAVVAGIALFVEWIDSVGAHFRRVVWTAALSLAAMPLMGLAIFPSNHVVLILPFVLILALVWERWPRSRAFRIGFLLLTVLILPFGLYWRVVSVYDPLVLDLISVLPPVAAIAGLYWMRWWVLRSPRTWFDRVGEQA